MDRTVLITGATGAVGRAVTKAFIGTGARLALTSTRQSALEQLASLLAIPDERCFPMAADLSQQMQAERLITAISDRWGGVDVLLNITGGWSAGKRAADVSDAEWESMLTLNLTTAWNINRAVLPHMVEHQWGRIVNLSARAAVEPGPRQVAYNVAKAGVVALTKSIAADYRRRGIAANVVLPSMIDTPQNRDSNPDADHSRWVKPEDLAELLLYLASDAGGSLNGAAIPVYGQL